MAMPAAPKGLRTRGRSMWNGLRTEGMPKDQAVILEEACRTADILDEIHQAVANKPFVDLLHLEVDELGEEVTLKIDSLLNESRQQQQNLKQLLVTVRQLAPGAKVAGNGGRSRPTRAKLAAVEDAGKGGDGSGSGRGWRAG